MPSTRSFSSVLCRPANRAAGRPRRTLIVGLTGGIGTGKSTALKMFKRLGASTVSLDEIAHQLSRRGTSGYRQIVRSFGTRFVGRNGELDRKALGTLVFRKPALRRRLEKMTHPGILREMRRRVRGSHRPVMVVDAPLLFEANVQKNFDVTCVVSSSVAAALRRVIKRNGLSRAQVRQRMRAQMPMRRKEERADVVVHNDGSISEMKAQIREFYRALGIMSQGKN